MANLVAQELGKDFGLYHVLGVLGDGSMGRLYLAERRGPKNRGEIVALKSFYSQFVPEAHLRGVLSEASRIAAALVHPNIVSISELGALDERTFMAMEYLAGENLASILASVPAGGPMPPALAAAMAQQIIEGMRFAHDLRMPGSADALQLYPDLRPSNIFVTYEGVVKILGCAEGVLCGESAEVRSASRGGLAYTAPEAIERGARDVRTEIFSVGVMLWECLTGRQLFGADTQAKTIEAVRSRYIEPPSVFRPEAPPGLDEVVLRATSRDPRRRYQSSREMSLGLGKVLAHVNATADAQSPAQSLGGWLESRFGVERAALKTQIARGVAVEAALVRLRLLGDGTGPGPGHSLPSGAPMPAAPGDPPSTASPAGASPAGASPAGASPAGAAAPRRNLRMVYAGASGLVAVAVGVFVMSSNGPGPPRSDSAPAVGALQIESTPPGAQILIDGDPSGLVTPARINGLRAGRKVEIRVDKPGYGAAVQIANIPLGGPQVLSFALEESMGKIHFEGIPTQATAYVDEARVDLRQPLALSVGSHRLRVEISGRLLGSMKFEVRSGEHTVHAQAMEGVER